MRTNPRIYRWDPLTGHEPFVDREIGFSRDALQAADGHRIVFPARILNSEHYGRAQHCWVQICIEDGHNTLHPDVQYEMEIRLGGLRRVQDRVREAVVGVAPNTPTPPVFNVRLVGVAGSVPGAVFSQMTRPTEMHGRMTQWRGTTTLLEIIDAVAVGARTRQDPSQTRITYRQYEAGVWYVWLVD